MNYTIDNKILEDPREKKSSELLLNSLFGRLCYLAFSSSGNLSNNADIRRFLQLQAEKEFEAYLSEGSINAEDISRSVDVAVQFVTENKDKQNSVSAKGKKNKPAVVEAVDRFLATSPNVFISPERQEMFLVEKGFLSKCSPEEVKELRLPYGYSPSEKYRLFSLLQQKLDKTHILSNSEQSLDSLIPESACVFEDGTVLSAKNGNLSVCKYQEWKDMPFASAIKANFSSNLANAGYNYQTDVLKAEAPYFWNYLQTSFDIEEARKRLCQMIGATLTPVSSSSIPSIWNLIGEPGCGKGVICKFLQGVFDKEAVALVTNLSAKNNRFAFSRLVTARKAPRFLLTPDISASDVYNSAMFNMVAGGDSILVEEKCVKSQTVSGKLTWVIASNSHLRFRSNGDHLAEKIVEIPFETHTNFRKSKNQIEALEVKLLAEADAILSFSWGVLARTIKENEKVCYALRQKVLGCDYESNPLLEMLEKHAFIDYASKMTMYDASEAFKEYMEGAGLDRWYEQDSVYGDKERRPSQLFRNTFKKWLKIHNLKSGNVVRKGKCTARTYAFAIDLDVASESFEVKSEWHNSWDYQPMADAGIFSPAVLEAMQNDSEEQQPAESDCQAIQQPILEDKMPAQKRNSNSAAQKSKKPHKPKNDS